MTRTDPAPLCDEAAEMSVLSAMLLEPGSVAEVCAVLRADEFFLSANATIYRAICRLAVDGRPVDVVSVAADLRQRGSLDSVGGTPYLAQVVDTTPAVAHVIEHARIVADFARRRRIAAECEAIAAGARNGDSAEVLEDRIKTLTFSTVEQVSTLPTIGVSEIFAPLPPVNWIVEELDLCAAAPLLIAGFGFSAKTMAAQSLLVSVATGQPVWGTFKARQGKVLHVDYEQGRRLTSERYQRLAMGLTVGPSDLDGNLVLSSLPSLHLDSPNAEELLCRAMDGFSVALFDSFRAAAPSYDENDSKVREPLDMLNRVTDRTGCATIVIHHAKKPQKDSAGGAKTVARGSGAIFDACNSVLIFDGAKGGETNVVHPKARTSGRLTLDFNLSVEDVELGGNPRAGLIVLAGNRTSSDSAFAPGAALDALKANICEFFRVHGDQSSKGAIRERLGCNRNRLFAAFAELEASGEIINLGKHPRSPVYHLVESK